MTVYWIGGSPCAGKTTISNIIAQEFGWLVYSIDRYFETYLQRADSNKHPHLTAYSQLGLKQFLLQDPQKQLEQIIGMSQEQFEFILDDLAQLKVDNPENIILVEGSNILADSVSSQIASPKQAMWIVPTETFQLETYPKRGSWVQGVLRHHYQAEEGIIAFERWMERDANWAKFTASKARKHNIPVLIVDGSTSLLDNTEMIMRYFDLLDESV